RFSRDWSSDVCSSDLGDFLSDEEKQSLKTTFSNKAIAEFLITQNDEIKTFIESNQAATIEGVVINQVPDVDQNKVLSTIIEKYKIGRASCRERVETMK